MGFNIGSGVFWGWGWLAGVGVVILLGLFLLPWFFILLNLQTLLNNVQPSNRRMRPGLVWLNFIPVFFMVWFIYTVIKVKDSLHAEFESRGWYAEGDLGYNAGLTAGILWVAAHFIGWIPFIGWVLPLVGVICWIIYWLKTSDLKNRLDSGPAWNRMGPYQSAYPPAGPPYAPRYPWGHGARPAAGGPAPAGDAEDPEAAAPVEGSPQDAQPGDEQPRAEEPQAEPAAPDEQPGVGAPPDEGTAAEPPAESPAGPPAEPPAVEPVRECEGCGARYDLGDSFCRKCGSRVPLPPRPAPRTRR